MKLNHSARSGVALLTASVLALSLVACGPEDPDPTEISNPTEVTSAPTTEPAPPETTEAPTSEPTAPSESVPEGPEGEGLDELRERLEPSAAMAGVMYLGYLQEGSFPENWSELERQDLLLEYTFLGDITGARNIRVSGGEVYCIIPGDPAASVTVTEWDAETNSAGKVLYESKSGEPIVIQGNASDIMPNFAVSITNSNGETMMNYHPHISLKDGSVSTSTDDGSLVLELDFPDVPEGSTLHHFDLHVPSEDFQKAEPHRQHIVDLTDEYLMQLLVENRAIPDSVRLLGTKSEGTDLILDLSKDFADYMNTLGEQEQKVVLACVVNSWLAATGHNFVVLTVEGEPLETEFGVYSEPMNAISTP